MNPATMAFYEGQGRLLEMIARDTPVCETLEQLSLLIEAQSEGLYCSVLLLDADGVHIHPGAGPRLPAAYVQALDGYAIGPAVGSCGTAMYRKEIVIVTDILEDPLWVPYKFLVEDVGFRACWSTPIVSKDDIVIGAFAMYYKEVRSPGPDETGLMAIAANIAGIAIERQRREDQLQRYRGKLEALVAQRTDELEQTLLEQRAIFDNANAGIQVVKDRLTVRCNRGFEAMLGFAEDELVGKSTRMIFPSDEAYEEFGRSAYSEISAGKCYIGEGQLTRKDGETRWFSSHGSAIDPNDLSKGTIWISQDVTERKQAEAALVDAKNRLELGLAEVEQTYREVTLLAELSSFLQACQVAQEAYKSLDAYGPRLFPTSAGALYLMDERGELQVQASWAEPANAASHFLPGDCWALRRGQSYRMDDPLGGLCCPHLHGGGARRFPYACLPLVAQGETFGLLFIEHRQNLEDAGKREMRHRLAVALAEQAGLALANIRLREALHRQSTRDPLTGLYNRRYMNDVLRRELGRARRGHDSLAVAILDIDFFKHFNDDFGHDAGDCVLQNVARVLETCVRPSDVVCRFGGEEFAVLMPETSRELAEQCVGAWLDAVRKLDLTHGYRSLGRITVSLGLALYPSHGETGEALLEAAEGALNHAKESGRDRYRFVAAPV